ncbi:DUF3349 domain-containing protein [Tsukamurella soli]|uniref:DUF3349 domain-containing protein n=1 Tax=Tsukamurella soli TaxID=644556 RepID=A0ABP8K955_9ACTN
MARGPGFIARITTWLRAGYPDGVPVNDYQPLLALLERQLTKEEVKQVTRDLIGQATVTVDGIEPITRVDAGVAISSRTNDLPLEHDIERVRERLERKGWPFDNDPLGHDTNGAGPGPDEQGPDAGADPPRTDGDDDPHGSGPYGGA